VSVIGQGGAEKIMAQLAALMANNENIDVDLVVVTSVEDEIRQNIPPEVNLVELNAKHYMSILKSAYEALKAKKIFRFPWLALLALIDLLKKTIFPITSYINEVRPDIIFTAHYNSITIVANWFAKFHSKIVITEHTVLSRHFPSQIWFIRKFFPAICRFFYPKATKVIGVSEFVSNDLVRYLGISSEKAMCIYNPIIGDFLVAKASGECIHPWLGKNVPIFIAVGRLSAEKDFKTLLEAFAISREIMDARLLILGDGALRTELQEYAKNLKIDGDIDWLGFVDNPLPYIKKSDVFIMSSLYEGLPTVVIEALYVGTTVVATDAPGGIREILNDGEYGNVVPMRSPKEMSDAMMKALKNPFDKKQLTGRAMVFSAENSIARYNDVIECLLQDE
jgi:glycosyltransferase involved in cell wall biosynthesis